MTDLLVRVIDRCRLSGYSFFPIPSGTKVPRTGWKKYQKALPSDEEVEQWKSSLDDMNLCIVTGEISDIVVVDLDLQKEGGVDREALNLPKTYTVKTGGGGEHHYFRYPRGHNVVNAVGIRKNVDIRANGGIVVAPGSIHPSGELYEVIDDNGGVLAECPEWVYSTKEKAPADIPLSKKGIASSQKNSEGTRNDRTTRWLGAKLRDCDQEDFGTIWEELVEFNDASNTPPLEEFELRSIFESICSRELTQQEERPENQTVKCMSILNENGRFIRDQIGNPYFVCKFGESQKLFPIESKGFQSWLRKRYYEKYKTSLGANMMSSIEDLATCCANEGDEIHEIHIRLFHNGDMLLYDLIDSDLRCVHINEDGWKISSINPGFFRRGKNNLEQVQPQSPGDIDRIWNYINITDPKTRLLVLSTIITGFIADIQHPLLMIHGPKGAAKSTFLEVFKMLIDPSSKGLLSLPGETSALIHTFLNDYLMCYDNISIISHSTSDDLCRAVTGGSLSKRQLFTDGEDIIYNFRKAICVNGINLEATQPDLLQRSIIVQLESISEDRRITPSTFWKNFKADLPFILGGIFDILAKAIRIEKSMDENEYSFHRLADYNKWGEAICQAMDNGPGVFGALLDANMSTHDEVALSANNVPSLLREFMDSRSYWEGTPTDLRSALYTMASYRSEGKNFPTTPHTFMKILNRFKESLEHVGILIESGGKQDSHRIVKVRNINTGTIDPADPFR